MSTTDDSALILNWLRDSGGSPRSTVYEFNLHPLFADADNPSQRQSRVRRACRTLQDQGHLDGNPGRGYCVWYVHPDVYS